ncbi:hypothetical protein M422DRAFT_258690 [Sphaerobolus stellatus SS14]|uniref:Uncharacterized protein n=1 Tax=Sphaerobolus stellatus (strain SS14) TaxID=990650 RepID=A0A0C9VL92_SPHS4|nr:hypothetical protein M422DRAFT_258690 [Sphaerobolus stellatus SS14]
MMKFLELHLRELGVTEAEWNNSANHIHCMPHVYNLAVVNTLKALTMAEAFRDEIAAAEAELTAE